MSPAFIKGCTEQCPNARITFDKFHVVWHASTAVDRMRRIEQRTDRSLKGMRWSLLKDRSRLSPEAVADLDALIAKMTTVRTAGRAKDEDPHVEDRPEPSTLKSTARLQHIPETIVRGDRPI